MSDGLSGARMYQDLSMRKRIVTTSSSALLVFICMASLSLSLVTSPALGDPLLGDAVAAYSTAEAAEDNPANAAFLDQTQFSFVGEMIKNEQIDVRYPGFEPTKILNRGVAVPTNKPGFIFKANKRISYGGFILPPLPIAVNLERSRIPVIILGTQNYVDLKITAKIEGLASGTAGFRLSERFGVGVSAKYQAIKFKANLAPSSGGSSLADVDGKLSQLALIVGARMIAIPGTLQFGVAAALATLQSQGIDVNSPLIGDANALEPSKSDGAKARILNPLDSILVGTQLSIGGRVRLLADMRYTKAVKAQAGFSLVALKPVPQDLHDTLSVRSGALVRVLPNTNLLLGFRYEPANLGPGNRSAEPLVGFGTMNLIQIIAGLAPMTPYTMVAAGVQIGLVAKNPGGPQHFSKIERTPQTAQLTAPYYQLMLEVGIAYTYASLGIDSTGELPGAYLYRKVSLPFGLIYRF